MTKVRICHFSDWHGRALTLPPADIYVCTGDMYDNFPIIDRDRGSLTYRDWHIDPERERELQARQARQFIENIGLRSRVGNPDGHLVCVRGNHDYIDLDELFADFPVVHEFFDNELVELDVRGTKVRVTGHRGIPWIYGTWNDEVQRPDLVDRLRDMPSADLFLTHYPPAGVLDDDVPPGFRGGRPGPHGYGLEGMANQIVQKVSSDYMLTDDGLVPELKVRAAHCFGHIHGAGGSTLRISDVMFSNAATTFNTFDIEVEER